LLSLGAASAFAPVNLAVRKQTRYVCNVIFVCPRRQKQVLETIMSQLECSGYALQPQAHVPFCSWMRREILRFGDRQVDEVIGSIAL
jgi:hypothetical protein